MVELLLGILGLAEVSDIVIKGAILLVLMLVAFVLVMLYKTFANFWR